jgi:hypothetical protein
VPKRTVSRTIKSLAISLAIGLAVVAVIVGMGLYGLTNDLNLTTSRTHLKPIPIAASACPYVVLMHATANAFQSAEPILGELYYDAHGNLITPPWPYPRDRVLPAILNLQVAIFVSTPHFPPPIRHQLTDTLDAIHAGITQLAAAHDATGLGTSQALVAGQTAFGYASDLVGTQCRVPLGANSTLAQYVPTTTVRAAR